MTVFIDYCDECKACRENYFKECGTYPDVCEVIDEDLCVPGSHEDYDYYAREILNGEGYYDEHGHFVRFPLDWQY